MPRAGRVPRLLLLFVGVGAWLLAVSPGRAQIVMREEAAIAGRPFRQDQKPMPPGTGSISGQVLEAPSSTPIAGSLVVLRLTSADAQELRVIADSQGRYVFPT